MGLLHALTQAGQRGTQWELGELARAAGVPPLPDLKLPQLPALIGGCNLDSLAASVGPIAANAIAAQFSDPVIQALMTSDLSAKRTQLLGYLDSLDRQKDTLLGQIADSLGSEGALGTAQDTLGGIRSALGGAVGSPLGAEVLGAVAEACPVAAGLIAYAENTLDTLSGNIAGVQSFSQSLTSQLASLTSLRAAAEDALAELDAHLDILPALFTSLGGGP
ncbi:hypothetical protein E7T06_07325 [Deinococcus sp. Arct2-2]|uniref:hypothetical protein n=1 Tax=Deinococcus sp. Arct2-2 TaxID=2568653 RepID=UPI0010A3A4A7|nr:hypothetical protein [Deinococcus sp. Arct2-2]THF70508.1 hypothetical protein E7T06_07325 [Deinococcus sp. Arct2-2]